MARVEGYEFGRMLVDGDVHRRDVIVLPGRVVPNWRRLQGHGLVLEDLAEVLDELPRLPGDRHRRVREDGTRSRRARGAPPAGIEFDAVSTGEAVSLFAELDPTRTAAALHLTC